MNKETLEWALHRGHGRAVIWMENHYTTEFRETILDACLHFAGWDGLIEDSRAPYLIDVIHATGEPGYYEEAILAALEAPTDDMDQGQLIELACLIARLGNEKARDVAYRAAERRFAGGHHRDADDLINVDGLTGFAFVASLFYRYQPADSRNDCMGLYVLEEQVGEGNVRPAIYQVIAMHPELWAICLEALERFEANNARGAAERANPAPRLRLTYEEVTEEMEQKTLSRGVLRSRGCRLTDEAALRFARAALETTDIQAQIRLLSLFTDRTFPLPIEGLLPLAHLSDEKQRNTVIRVLSQHESPALRALAVELAAIPGREPDALRLFVWNSAPEDITLFLPMAKRIEDQDILHRFGMVLRDYFEENPSPALVPALLYLYQDGPCSFCRYFIVQSLIALNALPDSFRDECRYDACNDTRKLVDGGC